MCLALHWVWVIFYCYYFLPSKAAVFIFVIISEFVGGAGIANIVFMNHYGCEHPAKLETSFVALQLATTVNIDPSVWMNWFSVSVDNNASNNNIINNNINYTNND